MHLSFNNYLFSLSCDISSAQREDHIFIFISFYVAIKEGLENYLTIFDDQGQLILNEMIGTNLSGIGVGTFFIRNCYLFYVKNKIELVTYQISKN